MIKKLSTSLILSLFFHSCITGYQLHVLTPHDSLKNFRGINWGASPELVRETEQSAYLQSFNGFGTYSLSFSGQFADKQVRIDYSFKNNKLVEGSYTLQSVGDVKKDFIDVKNHLTTVYRKPDYRANRSIASGDIWNKINDYGKYKGPELYWEFENGFIALVAGKFKDEITITVMYVAAGKISDYNTEELFIPDPSQLQQ